MNWSELWSGNDMHTCVEDLAVVVEGPDLCGAIPFGRV
jgi:hypothetical protein